MEQNPTTPVTTPDLRPVRPTHVYHEGTDMLIYEELARSRQRELERAAREHTLARGLVAERRWTVLARFAARRADRARLALSAG